MPSPLLDADQAKQTAKGLYYRQRLCEQMPTYRDMLDQYVQLTGKYKLGDFGIGYDENDRLYVYPLQKQPEGQQRLDFGGELDDVLDYLEPDDDGEPEEDSLF